MNKIYIPEGMAMTESSQLVNAKTENNTSSAPKKTAAPLDGTELRD